MQQIATEIAEHPLRNGQISPICRQRVLAESTFKPHGIEIAGNLRIWFKQKRTVRLFSVAM